MNAEYIAKSLEAIKVTQHGEETIPLQEFADFIRQQQAEIEALNQRIERMIENQSHHEGIAHAGGFEAGYQAAKAKTLTDEEIQCCMGCLPKYNSEIVDEDLVKFARAILRKAQEK